MSTISQQVTPPQDPHANDVLRTIGEVADIVRVPVATLRYWHHEVTTWLQTQSDGPTAA